MNILVCIKQVPGSTKVEVDEKTGVLKRDGVDSKMNPYDLYALETALRIKEKSGGSITAMTMGPRQAEDVIKEAFMMGVDEGALVSDRKFAGSDVLATSYTLSQSAKKLGNFDIILTGKQTTDGDTAQVGPEMAEYLNIPHIANVTRIFEIADDSITVEMDMPNTIEKVRVKYPCLLTLEKDIFQPRLPSYRRKMATKDKAIRTITFADFEDQDVRKYGLDGSPTQVERIFPPAANGKREIFKGEGSEVAMNVSSKLVELKLV
ncbi:electron transfer flavoprotein subunit beta/FixA family protein [Youngiibacter fragilis]|uniref:Electron transfer flavoprotein small subunit n=1 Tax=Youngiibacter fragilis 232.1 TaxID=994573 RepID=V7I6S6_9CLOT|nr:electron transfer flavoprotein subunit beta/FixA family protein [Youngiibacter fragilis]ETA80914.1 electron transfer flavoprotein subunit beta [Youngiibacter fragilis 232.1]